ncbi:uroporphyrinogen-III C-methyltransferase [Rhodobacterales bacterium HKCCE2091]|nr:uroporphyrinogen-III C-methyltransferase [Rhodobacterales bacterium HKCCE2091]
MKTFPMFLRMEDREVVIAGGGEQAAQKARLVARTEARIRILAPKLEPELAGMVRAGRAVQDAGPVGPGSFAGAALVFVATGCPALDTALHAMAREAGALVNVVDRPDLCEAVTPSIVDRDPVVVAIGTEGTAPVLGRWLRARIETLLEPNLGRLAALSGTLRNAVADRVPQPRRRAFWEWVFAGAPRQAHVRGAEEEAARAIKAAIAAGGAPDGGGAGHIALVGAGPGARDLLTLRAVQRLQEADVIFYDRLVDPGALELARRDAERVFVGKAVGACAWPQDRINALIVAEARKGRRVVRLKSGDPGIFGRVEEELSAARAAGLAVEIVPGVTAASAAAASIGRGLTERGATERVVFATATGAPGSVPDVAALAVPGTTLALYMATRQLPAIRAALLRRGWPGSTRIEAVGSASLPGETHAVSTLARIEADMEASGIANPAVLLIHLPKEAALAAVAG